MQLKKEAKEAQKKAKEAEKKLNSLAIEFDRRNIQKTGTFISFAIFKLIGDIMTDYLSQGQ